MTEEKQKTDRVDRALGDVRRGSFDTTRWLAQQRMEGEWALGDGNLV